MRAIQRNLRGAFRLILLGGVLCAAAQTGVQGGPTLDGCHVFPQDNIWNTAVDTLPLDPRSELYIETIDRETGLHPDFGAGLWDGGPIGIPFNSVAGTQARVNVTFDYADESDSGPYPIPDQPAVEWGSDHHLLMLDRDHAVLYELYDVRRLDNGGIHAGSGAIFNLLANDLRPETWTSADAAGLPILPGLARYAEVSAGEIRHALRFTAPQTRRAYVWPARHYASQLTDDRYPPMGQRFRLKAAFDLAPFSPQARVLLRAMQKYGIILADNGSAWFISGAPDANWNDDDLHELNRVHGGDFEAVDVSSLMLSPDSAQAHPPLALRPEILANGAVGTVSLPFGQLLTVSVSLTNGSSAGVNADWWLAAETPAGWYYYVHPGQWLAAGELEFVRPAYQGMLYDLAPTEVANTSALAAGTYRIYFGVDRIMNGRVDDDYLDFDRVDVLIE